MILSLLERRLRVGEHILDEVCAPRILSQFDAFNPKSLFTLFETTRNDTGTRQVLLWKTYMYWAASTK